MRSLLLLTFIFGWAAQSTENPTAPWVVYTIGDTLYLTDTTASFTRPIEIDLRGGAWDVIQGRSLIYWQNGTLNFIRHDLATGNEIVLTQCPTSNCSAPNLSPDGTLMAFLVSTVDRAARPQPTTINTLHIVATSDGADVIAPLELGDVTLNNFLWTPGGDAILLNLNRTPDDLRVEIGSGEVQPITIEARYWLYLADNGNAIIGDYFLEEGTDGGIFRYDIADAAFARLTDENARAVISPLTFTREDGDHAGIYRLDDAGEAVPVLAEPAGFNRPLAWNRDETLLLFVRADEPGAPRTLHIHDEVTAEVTQLTTEVVLRAEWAE